MTGGTAGTLTGSGTDYVLPVTADSGGGVIVISIAQNVVMHRAMHAATRKLYEGCVPVYHYIDNGHGYSGT